MVDGQTGRGRQGQSMELQLFGRGSQIRSPSYDLSFQLGWVMGQSSFSGWMIGLTKAL